MTTPDLERRIRTWFADEISEAEAAPPSVYAFVGAIPQSMPPQHGLFDRRSFVLLAAALLVSLIAGAIAVGSGVIKLPSFLPLPSIVAEPSAVASPSGSLEPSPPASPGLVVYNVTELIQPPPANCTPPMRSWCRVQRIWIANADGSGAHELLPDAPGSQYAIGWTPDGSRILYEDSSCRLRLADTEGSGLETLPLETLYPAYISADPCDSANPSNGIDLSNGIAFSPDSARLAYVVSEPGSNGGALTTIAIYNLETREVTRLESTRATDRGTCVSNEGHNESPMWSPDGTQLLFERMGTGPNEGGGCQTTVLVVNADGTGLRVIVPGARRNPHHARWSPDGSLIAYHYGEVDPLLFDIFLVHPDGKGVRQLTTDGLSAFPEWTADGRIAFGRFADSNAADTSEVWIMNVDGGGLVRLGQGESLADLTGPNCGVCPYAYPSENHPDGLLQPLP